MELPSAQNIFSSVTALIALFALITSRRALRENLKTNLKLAIEKIHSLPSLEVVQSISLGEKWRVKLTIFNLRKEPFRIECVKVYRYDPIERTLKNKIKHLLHPFDWDYTEVKDIFWNPQGNLDDHEHYFHEACQFLRVENFENIMVTIPNLNHDTTYGFKVFTTHGNCFKATTIHGDRCHFPKDFERVTYP